MNKRERVQAVLEGRIPDRVPKGEFAVSEGLAKEITGVSGFEGQLQAALTLGFDFIAPGINYQFKKTGSVDSRGREIFVDPWGRKVTFYRGCPFFTEHPCQSLEEVIRMETPEVKENYWSDVSRWSKKSDLFVFALVDGIFQTLSSLLDFNVFLMAIVNEKEKLQEAAEKVLYFILEISKQAIKSGANGIILGEDIAYDKGTFVSPAVLKEVFFPCIKEITTELSVPVVFHADGDLNMVLDSLANLGLVGIHSLQPSTGMDLGKVKSEYGKKLTLIGNLDLDDLHKTHERDIPQIVKDIILKGAPEGRYMFSSASGILDDSLPASKIVKVYEEVEKLGCYPLE